MSKYFGWDDFAGMVSDFTAYEEREAGVPPTAFVGWAPEHVLFASYGGRSYEGDAIVILERDNKLYEVRGSHCSCNGLEGQWDPQEVTWKALAMRPRSTEDAWGDFLRNNEHRDEAVAAFWALVDSRNTP